MSMSHRERIETAWNFKEPDRIPIEAVISPEAKEHPAAARVLELIEKEADNFGFVGIDFGGFFGFPVIREEKETIEERPGEFRRCRRTLETVAGTFSAITYHPEGESDYHWEKRFVSTLDDFRRLAETPLPELFFDAEKWKKEEAAVGEELCPMSPVRHPLGELVRNATMEEVYVWLREEREIVHRFLEKSNDQVASLLEKVFAAGAGRYFAVCAHEMLLPPWMGDELFDEFVFPYDKRVNDVIHAHGGKLRAHCHGNCMNFLEKMADMGIDAIEPLERPPAGNVDLAEAKRRVGDRMMLCGNIPSERFLFASPSEVREQVREAVRAAASGGGFALRTSGGYMGTEMNLNDEVMRRIFSNVEAYILAGLEFGRY